MNDLPEFITGGDPRIGLMAQAPDGDIGRVNYIARFPDGVESVSIMNEETCKGQGGLEFSKLTVLDLYLERVGIELWADILGDLSPEEAQARIEALDTEIERRESPPPVEGEAASEAQLFPF